MSAYYTNKTVVVTGATSGIGRAIAEHFAQCGWTVFAGYRSAEDEGDLDNVHDRVMPVRLDVTDTESLSSAAEAVRNQLEGAPLTGLVNNAGIAQIAPLALQDINAFEAHLSVNATGVLRASQAFIDSLKADGRAGNTPGRIVTITSIGGEVASPFLGAYSASKHAAESITDTLRRELIVYGIDAIVVGPGSVKTPIWQKAKEDDALSSYQNTEWATSLKQFLDKMIKGGEEGLDPKVVAECVEEALTAAHPKARYAPVPNKFSNYILPTILPKRLVDRGFWRAFGLTG